MFLSRKRKDGIIDIKFTLGIEKKKKFSEKPWSYHK